MYVCGSDWFTHNGPVKHWVDCKSISHPPQPNQPVSATGTRLAFSEKTNKISPSLHNFYLDAIKHRGQTERSAKILKTSLKNEVYPEICRIQHVQGKIVKKSKLSGYSTRLTFLEKTNEISPSLHNFHLDAIKHQGQTETSAKILKSAMKADKVYP